MRSLFCLWACALAASAAAQASVLPLGYQSDVAAAENGNPFALRGFALANDGRLFLGINDQVLEVVAGGTRRVVYTFPAQSFGVGMLVAAGSHLYFGDGVAAPLVRYDPGNGVLTTGSAPAFTFDLALAPSGSLVASALNGGDNSLWLVDFQGGQHREIVKLTGPSGPLAFDPAGNLFYAVQVWTFPTPPGSVKVLRFDAAKVQAALRGGPPLTAADGTAVLPGLDGAYDLAFDDRARLYVSNPNQGGIVRTLPGSFALDPVPLAGLPIAPASVVALQLQFVDQGGAATFDPYQPANGGAVFAVFDDFSAVAEVRTIAPLRPTTVSAPAGTAGPGPVTFALDGLPPRAPCSLCVSAAAPVAERPLFALGGTPVWSGLDLTAPFACVPALTDATGSARLVLTHPGGFAATLTFQGLGIDAMAVPLQVGTSPMSSLTLSP